MTYYTTSSKCVTCPKWNVKVSLCGKYRFLDDNNPFIATFVNATCPIIENSKLPLYKQDKKYALMCCNDDCSLLTEFLPTIDTRQDYSQ